MPVRVFRNLEHLPEIQWYVTSIVVDPPNGWSPYSTSVSLSLQSYSLSMS